MAKRNNLLLFAFLCSLFFATRSSKRTKVFAKCRGEDLPEPREAAGKGESGLKLKKKAEDSIYFAIMDEERQAREYQCIMKKMWIDKLESEESVEGVEFYSYTAFRNDDCNISSVTVARSKYPNIDETAWQMHRMLEKVLERSKSGWIYVIGDAAYVDSSKILNFLHGYQDKRDPMTEHIIRGNCIERAYFFQEFAISTGILMSRMAVQNVLNKTKLWEIGEKSGVPAQSILGEIVDWTCGSVKMISIYEMAGNEFYDRSDYDKLLNREFDSLSICKIPEYIERNQPGTNGACLSHSIGWNSLVAWAGAPRGEKLWFFKNVRNMITDVPDEIGFYWHWNKPKLCILP